MFGHSLKSLNIIRRGHGSKFITAKGFFHQITRLKYRLQYLKGTLSKETSCNVVYLTD